MNDDADEPSAPRLIDRLRSLFGLGGASVRDDIEDALEGKSTASEFSAEERSLLKNVLGLHEVRVGDIMVPRSDIIALSMDDTLTEALEAFRVAGHSRLPVHGDTLDDPRGMIHIRDFVTHLTVGATEADLQATLGEMAILRPVIFAPPSMPALDLLKKMQVQRTHLALVIDEYGGTDGLVSIEDIVEVIVGDIEDEHDEAVPVPVEAAADGSFIADARAELDVVTEVTGHDLRSLDETGEIETLGGLIAALAGRVPVRGEVIGAGSNVEFEVLDADPRRLKRVRLRFLADRKVINAP